MRNYIRPVTIQANASHSARHPCPGPNFRAALLRHANPRHVTALTGQRAVHFSLGGTSRDRCTEIRFGFGQFRLRPLRKLGNRRLTSYLPPCKPAANSGGIQVVPRRSFVISQAQLNPRFAHWADVRCITYSKIGLWEIFTFDCRKDFRNPNHLVPGHSGNFSLLLYVLLASSKHPLTRGARIYKVPQAVRSVGGASRRVWGRPWRGVRPVQGAAGCGRRLGH